MCHIVDASDFIYYMYVHMHPHICPPSMTCGIYVQFGGHISFWHIAILCGEDVVVGFIVTHVYISVGVIYQYKMRVL